MVITVDFFLFLFFFFFFYWHYNPLWVLACRPVAERPLPDNTQHSQQTSVSPAGFEPAIPANDRPLTLALDRSATWIDN